jgi:NAD dependent epimerase/dehydratase family enzyme
VAWDGATLSGWQSAIDGCDVVINLAGRSVNCRYTAANRERSFDRVCCPRASWRGDRAGCARATGVAQASIATIYAHRYDKPNDEHSGILGGNEPSAPGSWQFSIDVARAWERTFDEAVTDRTRKVALRSAMTLSPDPGGVFDTLRCLTRRRLGGPAGHGRQFMSWILHEDFVAAVRWLIDRDDMEGL